MNIFFYPCLLFLVICAVSVAAIVDGHHGLAVFMAVYSGGSALLFGARTVKSDRVQSGGPT